MEHVRAAATFVIEDKSRLLVPWTYSISFLFWNHNVIKNKDKLFLLKIDLGPNNEDVEKQPIFLLYYFHIHL